MLYQLSYFPENGKQYTIAFSRKQAEKSGNCKIRRVDPTGPESRRGVSDGMCMQRIAGRQFLDSATAAIQPRNGDKKWSGQRESNPCNQLGRLALCP